MQNSLARPISFGFHRCDRVAEIIKPWRRKASLGVTLLKVAGHGHSVTLLLNLCLESMPCMVRLTMEQASRCPGSQKANREMRRGPDGCPTSGMAWGDTIRFSSFALGATLKMFSHLPAAPQLGSKSLRNGRLGVCQNQATVSTSCVHVCGIQLLWKRRSFAHYRCHSLGQNCSLL